MIACLKKDLLKRSLWVQKDIKLDEIMDELQYFNTREEAYKEDCVPVCFATTLRTAYTNLVVEHDTDSGIKNYVSVNLNQVLPHKGYDLVTFMSSLAVAKIIDCTKQENHKLMFNSQFMPIGIYNPDPGICDPVIYCHVIISDDNAESLSKSLLPGNRLVPITRMTTEGNLRPLLNEIILVKEDK